MVQLLGLQKKLLLRKTRHGLLGWRLLRALDLVGGMMHYRRLGLWPLGSKVDWWSMAPDLALKDRRVYRHRRLGLWMPL